MALVFCTHCHAPMHHATEAEHKYEQEHNGEEKEFFITQIWDEQYAFFALYQECENRCYHTPEKFMSSELTDFQLQAMLEAELVGFSDETNEPDDVHATTCEGGCEGDCLGTQTYLAVIAKLTDYHRRRYNAKRQGLNIGSLHEVRFDLMAVALGEIKSMATNAFNEIQDYRRNHIVGVWRPGFVSQLQRRVGRLQSLLAEINGISEVMNVKTATPPEPDSPGLPGPIDSV